MKTRKIKWWKIALVVIAGILIIGLAAYMIPLIQNLNTKEGQLAFKEQVNKLGFLGFLWLFGIQVVQILLAFIPGEPIEVLAGMCYGSVGGSIFTILSASIISTAIFFLVRKFGKKFIYHFFKEEQVNKMEKSKLFQNPKAIEKVLLILFLLPGTPKDLLAYIAGILPIRPLSFIFISTFARIPSVLSSTLVGENLLVGNFHISVLIYLITFLLVGVLILFMSIFDKSKETEKTLKIIQEEKQ